MMSGLRPEDQLAASIERSDSERAQRAMEAALSNQRAAYEKLGGRLESAAESKQRSSAGVEPEHVRIDNLLMVLRKNGVVEFNGAGLSVKLSDRPSLAAAQRVIVEELERIATESEKAPPPIEPPDPGAVEPMRHDLDDVLFGAK